MKRTKLLSLGFAAFLSLGFTTQATHVKASEAIEPKDITQAADQIYVSKLVPITTQQSIWVTEVKGGKTYSGYLYNSGSTSDRRYSRFTGYLSAGPYAPNANTPNSQ